MKCILDDVLTQVTSRNLASSKLKVTSFPAKTGGIPVPERVTLHVQDNSGRTLLLKTIKTDQYTDSLPLANLPEGNYPVQLYGKTWHKNYEIKIRRKNDEVSIELVSK